MTMKSTLKTAGVVAGVSATLFGASYLAVKAIGNSSKNNGASDSKFDRMLVDNCEKPGPVGKGLVEEKANGNRPKVLNSANKPKIELKDMRFYHEGIFTDGDKIFA